MSDFLQLVSGDQVPQLLDDVLSSRQKEDLPALGDLGDDLGTKRLAKLNTVLKKSPPLKPWSMRGKRDNAVRVLESTFIWCFLMLVIACL